MSCTVLWSITAPYSTSLYIEYEILCQPVAEDVYQQIIQRDPSYRPESGVDFVHGNGRQR